MKTAFKVVERRRLLWRYKPVVWSGESSRKYLRTQNVCEDFNTAARCSLIPSARRPQVSLTDTGRHSKHHFI